MNQVYRTVHESKSFRTLYTVSVLKYETITISTYHRSTFVFHPCLVPVYFSSGTFWFWSCEWFWFVWRFTCDLDSSAAHLVRNETSSRGWCPQNSCFRWQSGFESDSTASGRSFVETRGCAGALENYLAVLVNQVSVWVSLLIDGSSCRYMTDAPDRHRFCIDVV